MNKLQLINKIASNHFEFEKIVISEGKKDIELSPMGAIELISSSEFDSFVVFKVSTSLEINVLVCWVN